MGSILVVVEVVYAKIPLQPQFERAPFHRPTHSNCHHTVDELLLQRDIIVRTWTKIFWSRKGKNLTHHNDESGERANHFIC